MKTKPMVTRPQDSFSPPPRHPASMVHCKKIKSAENNQQLEWSGPALSKTVKQIRSLKESLPTSGLAKARCGLLSGRG